MLGFKTTFMSSLAFLRRWRQRAGYGGAPHTRCFLKSAHPHTPSTAAHASVRQLSIAGSPTPGAWTLYPKCARTKRQPQVMWVKAGGRFQKATRMRPPALTHMAYPTHLPARKCPGLPGCQGREIQATPTLKAILLIAISPLHIRARGTFLINPAGHTACI